MSRARPTRRELQCALTLALSYLANELEHCSHRYSTPNLEQYAVALERGWWLEEFQGATPTDYELVLCDAMRAVAARRERQAAERAAVPS